MPGSRPLIWIVDDSSMQSTVTMRALGNQYRSEVILDGEVLIEKLSGADVFPDLILLDWVMPGMSGDEVCRFVRSDPRTRHLPVVILTASRTNTESIVIALESGANDYLPKPFAGEELRARISTLLRAEEAKRLEVRQRQRLEGIVRLGRALYTEGSDVPTVINALADALAPDLCDGCVITFKTQQLVLEPVLRHRGTPAGMAPFAALQEPAMSTFFDDASAVAALPPACADYVKTHGLGAVATFKIPVRGAVEGFVTLTSDRARPFDDERTAIEACLDLTGLAIEAALRSQAERATTRFHEEMVGIVSHDLRTPLGAIAMGIELLQETMGAKPEVGRVLSRLETTTKRMTGIVNELLDVTRARLGKGIAVSRQDVELWPLVNGVLDELRLVHRGIDIRLEGAEARGRYDAERLAQVVANLVGNAVQHGRRGSVIAVALSTAGDMQTITVHNENDGEPIPAAQLVLLFDPFERGDARSEQGLGLGLYIVREIVRAHGGTVGVTSDRTGTMFRVELPRG